MRGVALAAIVAGTTLAGCARVEPRAGFEDVRQSVQERTGRRVHWRTAGSAEDAQADAAVADLLSRQLDADAAVQIALLNNRNLQASYEQLGVAQAQLVRSGLLRNPVFDVEAKFLEGGQGTIVELAFVQSLGDLLMMPLRKGLAASQAEEAQRRVAGEIVALAGDVRRAVVELQAARQMLELRQTTLAAADAAVELARALRDAGNITALDLAGERAAWEQAKLDFAAAEQQVTQGRERLNALMGLWGAGGTRWTIATRLPDPPADEPGVDDLERRAVERSLALAGTKQQVDRAFRTLRPAQRNALLDDVEVGVAAEREPGDEWAVGPALAVPIPLFDQGQSAAAIAGSDFRAARERYAAQAVETRAAARAAASQLRAARDQVRYQRHVILPLREEILRETQKHYNAMQVGAFQLLQARQAQVDAGVRYVELLREYWLARAAAEQLAAGGTAQLSESRSGATTVNQSSTEEGH